MDGETNGGQEATQGAQDQAQQQGQEQQETQQQGQSQVDNSSDYEKQIAERDERIASLEGQVAEQLRGEIAELKAQGESDRIDFKLQLAGVRNVKASCALLSDHGNDVDKLKETEPWLFEAGGKHAKGGNAGSGATGLPKAGAASDESKTLKHWREIAGLTDDGKKE